MINILLIEDSATDIFFTRKAFAANNTEVELKIIDNGEKAIEYFKNAANDPYFESPHLIILDLNLLGGISGMDVLKWVKGDDKWRIIPVVIMTTSDDQMEIITAYDNNANTYITKPINWSEYDIIIKKINDYWFNIAKNPKNIK